MYNHSVRHLVGERAVGAAGGAADQARRGAPGAARAYHPLELVDDLVDARLFWVVGSVSYGVYVVRSWTLQMT